MVPELVRIGPITLYSFGAWLAIAFLVAGFVVSIELRRKGMDPEIAWSMLFWAAVGGLAGSRLFILTYDWQGFLADPLSVLLGGSGFVFYGGLIGGFVTVSVLIWRRGLPWLSAVDAIAPAIAIAHAIGRVGCQVSGDGDWGKPTDVAWGMSYPRAVIGWEAWTEASGLPADVRVHPAPVYETVAYLAVFGILWRLRGRGWPAGSMLWAYLVLSSVARFGVEAVRIEPVVAAGLTQAQWIAIGLALLGSTLLVARKPA